MKAVVLTLSLIAALAIAGVFAIWQTAKPSLLPLEIAKACLNVLAAAVVVQTIAYVIARTAEARALANSRDELRRSVLERLNTNFTKVKAIRRRTRAALLRGTSSQIRNHLPADIYQSQMEELNDTQLDLELVAKDIETSSKVFRDAKTIFLAVSEMEEYLNIIVDEWESGGRIDDGENPSESLVSLPKIADLLGDYSTSKFRTAFVHNYYRTVEKVRLSMTEGESLRWKILLGPLAVGGVRSLPSSTVTEPPPNSH